MLRRGSLLLSTLVVAACSGGGDVATPAPDSSAAGSQGGKKQRTVPTAEPTADVGHDVKGEAKKGPSFSAHLAAKPSYKKGEPASVVAVVTALGDYHINQEYPYKFKLDAAPAGVTYPEPVVRDVARGDKKATIAVPFKPEAGGSPAVGGELSLSVCTDENCIIERVPLSVTVKVDE